MRQMSHPETVVGSKGIAPTAGDSLTLKTVTAALYFSAKSRAK